MTTLNENKADHQATIPKKILGIGTPILDCLFSVSNEYVNSLQGLPGGSILVDYPTLQSILKDNLASPQQIVAGGGAANTIKGLAKLGHACTFSGKIGQDEEGKKFSADIESYGIIPVFSISTLPTAQVACLITPDHDRTMRAFLGAGAEMNESDLTPELFKDVSLMHIEGYLMNRQGLVEKAMKLAKEAGAKISFDLSSFEIVEEYKKPMSELLSTYVDIVFANEEEALTLTGLPPESACELLKDLTDIAVVKMASNGSVGATKIEKTYQKAFKVKVIDTTGAGDLYASGFLHGFLLGKSLEECLYDGTYLASYVIQVQGAEIPESYWPEIKKGLSQFPKNPQQTALSHSPEG
jgi:sugar/nucleoside kinase (ribokinase family)